MQCRAAGSVPRWRPDRRQASREGWGVRPARADRWWSRRLADSLGDPIGQLLLRQVARGYVPHHLHGLVAVRVVTLRGRPRVAVASHELAQCQVGDTFIAVEERV